MVSIRAQMNGIGGRFQNIHAFLWTFCKFLIQIKFHFSGDKIWFEYAIYWGSYLTNLPLAKLIHICQLSLNTIELLAKSEVFENICILQKIGIHENFLIIQISAITQNYRKIVNFDRCTSSRIQNFYKKELIIFSLFYLGNWFSQLSTHYGKKYFICSNLCLNCMVEMYKWTCKWNVHVIKKKSEYF